MKKMMLAAAMFVTLSAFAAEKKINPRVLYAFKTEFASAQEVQWTVSTNYYKVAFDLDGQKVFAFYNTDGELIGLTRNLSTVQLPVNLQRTLKKEYRKYWISDLFEVANSDGTRYYVTLEDSDTKIILSSTDGSAWNTYKKDRKI